MASRCVSAISALHHSASPRAAISGFRSDIADTHLEAMLYILHVVSRAIINIETHVTKHGLK